MMIKSNALGWASRTATAAGLCGPPPCCAAQAAGGGSAAVAAGCWRPGAPGCSRPACRARPGCPGASAAGSLVHVPRPDYASPASVAAAFYTAWAGVDTVHDAPGAFAARCAPLVDPGRWSGSWPPASRRRPHGSRCAPARMVSLVQVGAVTRPDGAPAPTASAVVPARLRDPGHHHRLRPHDRQRRRHPPAGPSGGRWLVSAVLFY